MKQIIKNSFAYLNPAQVDQFDFFFHFLKEWNEKMNLVSRKNFDINFLNLLSISLFMGEKISPYNSLVDVGAGAGFPSIPLKILNNRAEIIQIEPDKKKVYF
ncbi:MAG: RsmG family class I SAM-dependent methyltransferase [Acidobacteriota bacterium]